MDNLQQCSTADLADIFNKIIFEFMDSCEPLCGSAYKNEYTIYKTKAQTAIKIRLDILLEGFIFNVIPDYGELIVEGDINKLMTHDYSNLAADGDEVAKIMDIKNILIGTTDNNRKIILEYLQLLHKIATIWWGKKKN